MAFKTEMIPRDPRLTMGKFEEIEFGGVYRVEKLKKRKRPCLRCDKAFWSVGKHNRICRDCMVSPAYHGASQLLDTGP